MSRIVMLLAVFTLLQVSRCHTTKNTQVNHTHNALTDDVKTQFVRSWEGYKKYAWGHDVLLPVSGGFYLLNADHR